MALNGGGGGLSAVADQIGSWEELFAVGLGGNGIALRALNGQYTYRNPPGYSPQDFLFAASNTIGLYETFYYYFQ
jgi:hypothetical protein